jgi:hypothetical protein
MLLEHLTDSFVCPHEALSLCAWLTPPRWLRVSCPQKLDLSQEYQTCERDVVIVAVEQMTTPFRAGGRRDSSLCFVFPKAITIFPCQTRNIGPELAPRSRSSASLPLLASSSWSSKRIPQAREYFLSHFPFAQ